MRQLWILALVVGCDDGGFTRVGSNDPTATTPTGPSSTTDTGLPAPACDQIDGQGLCTAFVGSSYTETEVQSSCVGGSLATGCPSADLLGICGLQVDTVFETRTYYYDGDWFSDATIDLAASSCTLKGGVWTP